MSTNPYEAPNAPIGPEEQVAAIDRTPFLLAAVGAGLASAYWALMTLLIGAGVFAGGTSAAQLIFPILLVGLYASRAVQVSKGDPAVAQRLIWLHALGCIFALTQTLTAAGIVAVLQGLKVVINLFGGATAVYALRAARSPAR